MILLQKTKNTQLSGNELKVHHRKKEILRLLYHEGEMSATEIGKRIGVSVPTSLSLLKILSEKELIENRGAGLSSGGRRPSMFGLKTDSIFVVACELDHYSARVGIYNPKTELVAPVKSFDTNIDDPELIEKMFNAIDEICGENKINTDYIYGVGLSMPGLIDEEKGINYSIKNPLLQHVRERLEERFGKLVYVNNDARLQAYGEYQFGAAKDYENALIVNWNWGLGFGMILDGKLYNGATGFAGELSHIKFVEDGELCICGKTGCLETVTSAKVLIRRAQDAVRGGKVSQLTGRFTGRENEIRVEHIIEAARSGDELSIALLNTVGLALGKALSTTIQLLNPSVIVMGGAVSEARQYVLTPIQQSINKHCLGQISENIRIVSSGNWEQSGMLGTAAVLFEKLFNRLMV